MNYSNRGSLVLRIRDPNDKDAWSQFANYYGPLIHRYASGRGLQDADAADVTQDVLYEVSNSIRKNKFDPNRGPFRNWIFGIARHVLCKRLRLNQKRIAASGNSAVYKLLNELPTPSDKQDLQEHRQYLFELAAEQVRCSIGETTWTAFWQTAVVGENPNDVAERLNLSVSSVYVAKSRVLARLRQKLAKFERDSKS